MRASIIPGALLLALALIWSACGDSSSSSTSPTELPRPAAGEWRGTTSAGRDVYLRVTADAVIDSITIEVDVSVGLGFCTGPLLPGGNITIENNEFSAEFLFPASTITSTVSGTFSSSNTVSGEYTGFSGNFSLVCGNTLTTGTGSPLRSGTWEAAKF